MSTRGFIGDKTKVWAEANAQGWHVYHVQQGKVASDLTKSEAEDLVHELKNIFPLTLDEPPRHG